MTKSFIDVVQDSPKTGLDIPFKTKEPPLLNQSPPAEPPFGLNFTGGWFQLKGVTQDEELTNRKIFNFAER